MANDEGYMLVDVRSMPEFEAGHPENAYNIPYLHKAPHGMVPNQEFTNVFAGRFPDKSTKLITSCAMGGRSMRAAQELTNMGYTNIVDMEGGFGGQRDESGAIVADGWSTLNLPTGSGSPDGRSYASIARDAADAPDEASVPAPAAIPPPPVTNRFAHPTKTVMCVKMGKELPALKRTPMGGPLGKKIKKSVSAQAWDMWAEHSKMIINEYRLNPADAKAQQMLLDQCDQFFFGEGAALPPDFVPAASGK